MRREPTISDRDATTTPVARDAWISPDYGRVDVRCVDLDHVYVKFKTLADGKPRTPRAYWGGNGDYFSRRDWPALTAGSTCIRRGDTTLTVPWTWHLGIIPVGAPVLWSKGKDAGQGVVQASSWDTTVVMNGKRVITLDGDRRRVELDLTQHTGRMLGALVAADHHWGGTFFKPYVAWMARTNGVDNVLMPRDACWSLCTVTKHGEQQQWDLPEVLTLGVERGWNEVLTDMSPATHAWALWTLLTTLAKDGKLP